MVFKLPSITLWHMLPISIGLHGLLFAIPIPSTESEAQKPDSDSVNVVNLPKPSPTQSPTSAIPTPKPQPTPKAQRTPPPRSVPTPAPPTPQPSVQVQPTPQPTTQPSPSISPSPSPSITPSPSPSPTDGLQIAGAVPGCKGQVGCWQIADSQGRTIARTLEQQLEQQGFTLTQKELDQDTGFRVYEVSKDGVKQYYLHMIWSDRGTAYVRNADLLSHSQITTLTGL
ncbi:hypothetical protein ACQ4M3_22055 [Leptolyngbya sp. AN03gr2]|uniref:hypothetical protein n=1 Tax=unclassified Leptolyngbya TaxID=2650499 RepID=UPI003D310C12